MSFPPVSLVIPLYNESSRINLMFEGIDEFIAVWQGIYEVILVDDGSHDDSVIQIRQHPTFLQLLSTGQIKLLSHVNTGKGGALKLGVDAAESSFILTLDADMATRPLELIRWLELRTHFNPQEILIGSRELKASVIESSRLRHWIGNIFNWIIRTSAGIQFRDTQCGFKLYPISLGKTLFQALQTTGWSHDVELLLRAKQLGLTIIEMPVHWKEVDGSKVNIWTDSWKMFWEVMRIAAAQKK